MQALIFDFDGTILDTESSEFRAWQEVYWTYGAELSLDYWLPFVGNNSLPFDPVGHLEALLGVGLDRAEVEARVERRKAELNRELKPLPGVVEYIEAAQAMGLGLALASSSSRAWVEGHLGRLGLLSAFQVVCTKEDVALTKPDPALFLRAAEALGVRPRQALAIEDSLNGVRAARAAGAFTVAVPNPITRHLDLGEADLLLNRLDDLPLWELVQIARGRRLFPVV
ncbi:Phosphorylated carbohydrates phosphatase [Meiothermus luteus]|jgi:HAD superfamily hydrolase (TIGR01509 family)|uniref:Phosphorylated carbohydrates phosphatase n=1 Tax=Meiothermus luteus TaxID=2026184 RepID=A0A399EU33_9DEIN|nr:HAD-IA family hydrolase [Meiothermus luteus]RIH87016.1 Phosphorylated carbohydrates phosphatase [Meiothermus luteus]RMH54973.1 MAG: HAD family hydrolase [Deinococcota bacterium]